jgi:hypothetical protein
MKVCQDWSDIVVHLSEFIIIRNMSDVSRLIKFFNESSEAGNAGDSAISASRSVVRLDIVLEVPEDVIPVFPYLSNLRIVVIHTNCDSPSTLLCDALMNSCGSSLQYFDWSGSQEFIDGLPHYNFSTYRYKDGLQKRFPSLLVLTTASRWPFGFMDTDMFDENPTPFLFPAPNLALLSTACFQRRDGELLPDFRNRKGVNACIIPLPSLKMLHSSECSNSDIFERLLQDFIGPSLTSVSIDDHNNYPRFCKEISSLASYSHITHLLIFLGYLYSKPFNSCLKDIELPDNIVLLGVRCRRASNGRAGYEALVAAIRSMKAVGLRELQLYEWNIIDIRTNHAEVWKNLRNVLREKGWRLSVLDFAASM